MAASKSSPGGPGKSGRARSATGGRASRPTASRRSGGAPPARADRPTPPDPPTRPHDPATRGRDPATRGREPAEGISGFVEQLIHYVINPLGLVVLTRERIQETLDEAAARGRLTRTDATELGAELVRRGRVQTDELLGDTERLIARGREQLDSAAVRSRITGSVDRIVRTADRARRTVGVGPVFPIVGYDDLTAAQINARLGALSPTELRRVREYERRHANRKSVLEAIERGLA